MEFDEHDYTGRTVENPGPQKARESTVKSGDKDRNQRSRHKNDQKDDGNDGNHRAKYSRSRDENRYHDRRKEGGSSRHRSRSRHRERDRDRGSRELKERDREDRKKDRERERDWERDSHRDRRDCDRYSERERERKQSRRSSSRSERHRSERDERDRERSRDRDREFRERETEREIRERDRKSRKKKEEAAEPVAGPERGQRTVFAYMSRKAGVWDVYDFFSLAGKIRDIRIILDPDSRQPKGCGYIEFFDVESVPKAIALYGKLLLDQPVLVRRSEAEKNPVWSTNTTTGGARKLYLGYLPVKTTEDQLRQVFGLFGPVESVQLPGEDGNHKGFGLVQFVNPEDARNALTWDGPIKIAGREIRLSKASDPSGMKPVDLGTPATPTTGLPSECFLLTDMFDPTEEAKADFDLDIKEDLEGECSKYGTLKHIHVHKNCPGLVCLRFDDTESAIAAQSKLHGRWYTMKQITAKFMAPLEYEAKFPDSE